MAAGGLTTDGCGDRSPEHLLESGGGGELPGLRWAGVSLEELPAQLWIPFYLLFLSTSCFSCIRSNVFVVELCSAVLVCGGEL